MTLREIPLFMTFEQSAQFLNLSEADVAAAVRGSELPVVLVEDELLVDTHQLILDLGVRL
ncbi:MAG: hypothetical protein QOJ90_2858 [Actinomycetota bacterium]|jgi:hypothetical protein|nr:hypothetical protein [Actinomycetota bacterium]